MKSSTAYNHRQRLLARVKDIHSSARIYGMTHEDILAQKSKHVWDDPAWRRIPSHYRSYISGYADALREEDYHHHLEWKVYLDGRYVRGEEVPSGRWSDVVADAGCHFWKKTGKYFAGNRKEETTQACAQA